MVAAKIQCNLFYVDDDPDDLNLFKIAAASLGEEVCVFEFADLMLHTLHNPPPLPSVVLVDLNMPTMNGFDVIKKIKTSPDLFHLPIIVYSTTANLSDINRCKLLGASLFITKPMNISGIRKVVEHILAIDWTTFKPDSNNFIVKIPN